MNKIWIKHALVRAAKTVAQTAIATIGTAAAIGQVDWVLTASAAALAGILSILTSIAGIPEAGPAYIGKDANEELTNGRGDGDEDE